MPSPGVLSVVGPSTPGSPKVRGMLVCARHRPGVLLVTHDVEEAVLLAHRVLVHKKERVSLD